MGQRWRPPGSPPERAIPPRSGAGGWRPGTYRHDGLRLDGHGHGKDLRPDDPPLAEVVHVPLLQLGRGGRRRAAWRPACARARRRRRGKPPGTGAACAPTPHTHLGRVHRRNRTVSLVEVRAQQPVGWGGEERGVERRRRVQRRACGAVTPNVAAPSDPKTRTRRCGCAGRAGASAQWRHQQAQRPRARPQAREQPQLPWWYEECAKKWRRAGDGADFSTCRRAAGASITAGGHRLCLFTRHLCTARDQPAPPLYIYFFTGQTA